MKFRWFVSTLVLVGLTTSAFAQFDDLYYDPNRNSSPVEDVVDPNNNARYSSYDDESYEYYEDWDGYYDDYYDYDDYQYSTRIRRFWSPSYNIGYYSPVWGYSWRDPFWDPWYNSWYDPWYGGNSVVVVFGNSGWGSWNRWNRWNNWGCGYNSWGWNDWGWNNWGWGNNYVVNNYYGWNRPWNGHHGGHHYNNNNGNAHPYGTYYGSRKSGSSIASTKGRIDGPRKDKDPVVVSPDAPEKAEAESGNRSVSNRQRRSDFDSRSNDDKPSIYNRKRSDVSGPSSGYNGSPRDMEPGRKSDPSPQMDKQRESDRPARGNNNNEQRSYERPRSSDNSNRSSHDSRPSRSYDSGSRNSGGNGGGGSSRSSNGGGGGGRSSSSPRRGG